MDKIVLITGGSRGIGAAAAVLAAQRGWAVAINYLRHAEAANGVVRQIEAAGGRVIDGSVHIPVNQLRDRLAEIPDGPVIVHCAVGVRGHTAARILTQHGRDVRNLDGGYRTWIAGTRAQRMHDSHSRAGVPERSTSDRTR